MDSHERAESCSLLKSQCRTELQTADNQHESHSLGPSSSRWQLGCRPIKSAVVAVAATGAAGVAWISLASLRRPAPDIRGLAVYSEHKSGRVPEDWLQRNQDGQLLYAMEPQLGTLHASQMPNLGNGYMAAQFGAGWLYVGGVYNGVHGSSHRAKVPTPFNLRPNHTRAGLAVDMARGTVEQLFLWPDASAIQRTYLHQAIPHLAVTELEFNNARGQRPLTVDLMHIGFEGSSDLRLQVALPKNANVTCLTGATRESEIPGEVPKTEVAICRTTPPARYVVPAGEIRRIVLHASVWTSRDTRPWFNGATTTLQAAQEEHTSASQMLDDLRSGHEAAMRELWKNGIEVEGNPELSKKITSSWWNILISHREDVRTSSSPGGLATGCYHGHSFWDVELFIWPNLLMFHPRLASAVLAYRADRTEQAAANAQRSGRAGLMFPWESGDSGQEVCPWSGGLKELHISGDVSFAFWRYWQATGDGSWLRSVGWPVLRGVAQFWASASGRAPVADSPPSIAGVTDVDESATHVQNSAYTNSVAKLSLGNAAKAAQLLGETPSSDCQWPAWKDLASALPIPFDEHDKRHREYSTAAGGNGLGVVMMQYPLDMPSHWRETWSEEVRRNDLHFFEKHGPNGGPPAGFSMYWWAFAVAWLGLGEAKHASRFLDITLNHFVFGPFHSWHEKPGGGGCPNFITGAGSFLQILWAGYGGVRVTDGTLEFHNPTLPPKSTGLKLQGLAYRGSVLDVRITATQLILRMRGEPPEGAPGLAATHAASPKKAKKLVPGEAVALPSKGIITLQPVARSR